MVMVSSLSTVLRTEFVLLLLRLKERETEGQRKEEDGRSRKERYPGNGRIKKKEVNFS